MYKKSHLISSQGTMLSFHMVVHDETAQENIGPHAGTFLYPKIFSFKFPRKSGPPNLFAPKFLFKAACSAPFVVKFIH